MVEDADAKRRLDQFLSEALGEAMSRSRVQALIESGEVTVNGRPVLISRTKLAAGDTIEMVIPEPEDAQPQPEAIPLDILYEDDALIVLDKPAGLVVHPGAGNGTGTLVNALLHHCGDSLSGIGGVRRPGIVHRLDKDTSGVMVVAKTDTAHRALSEQFAAHGRDGRMERAYLAIVWGVPARRTGIIDTYLARSTADRLKRAVAPATRTDARHAVTHYAVQSQASDGSTALVECELETGRTHQIRVHLAHLGHPLLGDDVYGGGFCTKARTLTDDRRSVVEGFRRQALHAFRLVFEHPVSGETMAFETEPPEDFARLANALDLDLPEPAIG
ncbi:RluA family pseudouridine synthase [Mangrovicella endophytica]|uniref:RluA family pseudouridine synthase n=1 Tax=Mangrovicella endophytica TaxID=2066697 RepID=UPI000C9DA944|nr:RluA family pseudouridine synthase [Mangrovicella endophytica]